MAAPFTHKAILPGMSAEDACIQVLRNYLAIADDFSQIYSSVFQSEFEKYKQTENTKLKFEIMVEFLVYAGSSLEVSKENSLQAKYIAALLGISEAQTKVCWTIAKQKVLESYQSSSSNHDPDSRTNDGAVTDTSPSKDSHTPSNDPSYQKQVAPIDQSASLLVASICGPIIWLITGKKDYFRFIVCMGLYLAALLGVQTQLILMNNSTMVYVLIMIILQLFATLDIGLRSQNEFAQMGKRRHQTAVLISAFLSYYTWAYTCKRDRARFLVVFTINHLLMIYVISTFFLSETLPRDLATNSALVSNLSMARNLSFIFVVSVWIWSVVDSCMHGNDGDVYENNTRSTHQ